MLRKINQLIKAKNLISLSTPKLTINRCIKRYFSSDESHKLTLPYQFGN